MRRRRLTANRQDRSAGGLLRIRRNAADQALRSEASSRTDPKVCGSSKAPDRDRSRSPSFLAHSSVALLRREQAPVGDGAEPLRKPPTRSGLQRGPGRRTTTTSYRPRTRPGRLGWRKQAPVGSGTGPLEAADHKDRPRRRRSPRAQCVSAYRIRHTAGGTGAGGSKLPPAWHLAAHDRRAETLWP